MSNFACIPGSTAGPELRPSKTSAQAPVRNQKRAWTLVLVAIALLALTAPARAIQYRFVELSMPPELAYSAGLGINNAGQVVGASSTAILWTSGTRTSLDPLGSNSAAYGINDTGTAVGYRTLAAADSPTRPTAWRAGVATDLGGPAGVAHAVNAGGQIVGWSETAAGNFQATLWSGPNRTALVTPDGADSQAYDINNVGQSVGITELAAGGIRATLWSAGQVFALSGLGKSSFANAINDRGQVVGASYGLGDAHAVLWDNTTTAIDLGTLGGTGSEANDINSDGWIVGSSRTFGNDAVHATFWDSSGIHDLNDFIAPSLGWYLTTANAINDTGWITGTAVSNSAGHIGVRHAYVLIPVPEPQTYWLLMSGLGAVCWRVRRRGQRRVVELPRDAAVLDHA